jgi:hypothetical protein
MSVMPRLRLTCSLILSFALGCASCAPQYDWRIVNGDNDGFDVMMPGKITTDERPVVVGGQPLPMRMHTVECAGAVFAIGVVTLPSDDAALRTQVLTYLQTGISRNLAGRPVTRPVTISLAAQGQSVSGVELAQSGMAAGEHVPRQLQARFVARGRHVYEAAIVGEKLPAAEQSEQFFSSLRLY